jgi:hypothetical protein
VLPLIDDENRQCGLRATKVVECRHDRSSVITAAGAAIADMLAHAVIGAPTVREGWRGARALEPRIH